MKSVNCFLLALCCCILLTSVSAIISGEDVSAYPYNFGYQVSLRKNGTHYCSGSILASRWIVTAYRCIKDIPLDNIRIVYGARRLSEAGRSTRIARVFKRSEYSEYPIKHDIALLLTTSKIQFEVAETIALPARASVSDDVAIVSGWGVTEKQIHGTEKFSDVLQSQITKVMSTELCRSVYGALVPFVDNKTTLCTKNNIGNGVCAADRGGPLVSKTKVKTLIGIVSWYTECGEGKPDGYTTVFPFVAWIRRIIYNTEQFV